jgi:hypothetical protein
MHGVALVAFVPTKVWYFFDLIIESKIEVNCYTMQSLGLKVYRYGALVAVHVQVAGLAVDLVLTF